MSSVSGMSSQSNPLSTSLYGNCVSGSVTKKACDYLRGYDTNGFGHSKSPLAVTPSDTTSMVILKSVTFKFSMAGLFGIALIESVAKCAIAIIATTLSLLTTLFARSFSEKAYAFSSDLMRNNYAIDRINDALYALLFE